jgi:subtilisin family serine protease
MNKNRTTFILPFVFLVTFLNFSAVAQQFEESPVITEQEAQKLKELWADVSFKWENNRESLSLKKGDAFGQTLLKDTTMMVRFMGFDKSGAPLYYQTYNLFGAYTINTHHLWRGGRSELNLNGEGITLHVWDGGKIRETHQEFENRTTQMDSDGYMVGHATHVAGTMVSAGRVPTARGMASKALLHSYTFTDDEPEMIEAAANGALLSNHSYGRPTGWVFHTNQWWWHGDTRISEQEDYKFGFYSEETRVRDEITYFAPYYLQVHAAGNDRVDKGPSPGEEHNVFDYDLGVWVKSTTNRLPDGGEAGYDAISTLVLGKNVLTVGAVSDVIDYNGAEDVVLTDFSSTGPTDDGRIKPDVVAKGLGVLSTWVDSNSSYAALSGTSMATPTVTGSLGLIQQLNKRLFGSFLRASTLKALLIHTTREAGPYPGPDYMHGWGLADLEAAALLLPEKDNQAIIQERNLVQDAVPTWSRIVYSTGTEPLVATLVWTDVPAEEPEAAFNSREPMLVNDLDVRLIRQSDQQVFYPWKLNAQNPSAPATKGDNLVDNVEKIFIETPETGEYIVEVSHKGQLVDLINESNKRQSFSIVISGIAERAVELAVIDADVAVSGCDYSSETPAFVVVKNNGQQSLSNIEVFYEVTNKAQNVVAQGSVQVDSVMAGSEKSAEISLDLSLGFEFEFKAWIDYPGDQLPVNNIFTRNIKSNSWILSDETYHVSFEGIIMPGEIGWQVFNENNDASGWMLRIANSENQFASDGFNTMRYGVMNPDDDGLSTENQADDWLISSCIYMVPNEFYRLSFDYRAWNADYTEKIRAYIGTSPDPAQMTEILLDVGSFNNLEYITAMHQFTVQEEGTYYIGFQVYSEPDHRFLYLDNVIVERMVFNDVTPLSMSVDVEGCNFSTQTPVDVTFTNLGLDTQESFDVQLYTSHLESGTTQLLSFNFNGTLTTGEKAQHQFLADMGLFGKYELLMITNLTGDENTANDTIKAEVTNTSVNLSLNNYFTNFDDVTELEQMGWSVFTNTNQSPAWRLNNLSGQANSRPNSLNMYKMEGTPMEWVFSNCMVMEEGVNYRVKFYTSTQGTNTYEQFKIYLNDQPVPEETGLYIGTVEIDHFDYQVREYVFSAPSSGNFFIGLYADYTGPNTFQIFVDDFSVEKVNDIDASVNDIIQQTWGCNAFTNQTPVKVVIENKGNFLLDRALVNLRIEDEQGNETLYSLNSELALETTETDTLDFIVDLSAYNTIYNLSAEVVLENDENQDDNQLENQIRNTTVDLTESQIYTTDFEDVEIDGHSSLIQSQTGWWYENSNNDLDSDGTPITWVMRKNAPFALSGEVSLRTGRSLENTANDWVFSNCYLMEAGENYLLKFNYTGRTSSSTEKMAVYLGSEQSSESMSDILWDQSFSTGLTYQEANVTLSPDESGYYYVGFHHYSDADEGWIYMDDVSIQKNADIDVELSDVSVLVDACEFSENTPFQLEIKNSGNGALEQPMDLEILVLNPEGEIISSTEQEINQVLAVNEALTIDFSVDLRYYGIYTITATVNLPEEANEQLTENNEFVFEVRNTSMFPELEDIYISFEDFDDFTQTGFSLMDINQDGFSWGLGTTFTSFSFSGSSVLYYSFNQTSSANDWLFSSCAHLKAGVTYNLSYYYRVYSGDYPENLKVGIASSPHPDNVLEILDTKEEMVNYNFRRISYAFKVPDDGVYYFAWQAFSPKYHRYIFIDDLLLQVAPSIDGAVQYLSGTYSDFETGPETPFSATIANTGAEELPAGTLDITINGPDGEQNISLPTPTLPALSKAVVDFKASLLKPERHTFNFNLSIPGDQVSANNSGSASFYGQNIDLRQPGSWFIQDLETIFSFQEIGWTSHNVNEDNRYWGLRVNDPGLSNSGHNYAVYFTGNTTNQANDWLISNGYQLSGDRKYKAAFFYRLGSGTHNMILFAGKSPTPSALTKPVWTGLLMSAPSSQPYKPTGSEFQVDETGMYFFGLRQFSSSGSGSSLFDDFVIIAQPEIIPLTNVLAEGMQVKLEAVGSDSLRWYADEALTQEIGLGLTHEITVSADTVTYYAAEYVYGVMGPSASVDVAPFSDVSADLVLRNGFAIYPNPASSNIRIDLPDEAVIGTEIKVLNITGETLFYNIAGSIDDLTIDIRNFNTGVYLVVLTNNFGQWQQNFIKF